MTKNEVIKGIIHHKLRQKSIQKINHDECFDCPYRPDRMDTCESIEPLLDDVLALLKEQEAAVQCENCFNKKCWEREGNVVCGIDGAPHSPDGFCAYGKRKKGR